MGTFISVPESTQDPLDILNSTFFDETLDRDIERAITIAKKKQLIHEYIQSLEGGEVQYVVDDQNLWEKIFGVRLTDDDWKALGKAGSRILDGMGKLCVGVKNFAVSIKNFAQNKRISEEYIIEKFGKLYNKLASIPYRKAQVEDVPTYELMHLRCAGLLSVCGSIKEMSEKDPGDLDLSDSILDRVANLSKNVLQVTAAEKGSSVRNLAWHEPQLTTYDVKASKWCNEQNLNKLKNVYLDVKFNASEDLDKASEKLIANCKSMVQEEHDDKDELVDTYSTAYIIGKMIKQVHQFGIQREINTCCTTYLDRLMDYKSM